MLIRIFSRTFAPLGEAQIDKPVFNFDYLALDATAIVIAKELSITPDNYVVCENFEGIITAVDLSKKGQTTITVKPLLEMLNINAYRDRTKLNYQPIENYFAEWITEEFITNTDAVQCIEGLVVEKTSATNSTTLNLVDDVNNIYEIAVKALLKYKLVIDMKLKPQEKKLFCSIGVNSSAADYVRTDTANIIAKNIVLADDIGSYNKYTAVDGSGFERNKTYYADGYTDPCKPTAEVISSGSKSEFREGTKYKWVYMPHRPKRPQVYIDAKFVDAGCWIIINSVPIAQWNTPGIIVITPTLYFFYPFETETRQGYTFTAENWHQLDDGVYSQCPDGYPSTGLDENGKPGVLIDGEVQISTRLEMLGDYVSTQPIEFYERAVSRTYELFKQDFSKNLVELTTLDTDRMMPAIEIGKEDNIIINGEIVPSILTGYKTAGRNVTRVYGGVRQELTKKLKFERR